ncbi:hypothetical protein IWQ56_000043 [Coemansia nantahalensis]|uniref:Uncharacterized protein n=2 Tax=Coemansia TaxID=4863 RepID=A0ACC1L475_9FUNG|nr:hypothetical protein IWQ57_002566 [Coemansia nantahalensis]KAJ2775405.1 hypothetical protein IWQ56_000043 [Coemansia nantahalensis]KAJ2800467.1 hypothetical protein H4R21_003166 [Coemansia helicoidea]
MTRALQLYRSILRTHRRLPRELRFVGDQYVRSEFRSHRTVTDKRFLDQFYAQWTAYLSQLREQTGAERSADAWNVGRSLDPELVSGLDDAKAEQLLELHRASSGAPDQASGSAQPPRRK